MAKPVYTPFKKKSYQWMKDKIGSIVFYIAFQLLLNIW
jgi:hypothetical protein